MLSNSQKKSIDKAKVVSFDIFDTLIKRMVSMPSDVFDMVEKKYNINNKKNIKDFKKMRIQSEKEARQNSRNDEVTIDEIYMFLSKKNKNINIEQLKQYEKNIEIMVCRPLKENCEILDYCIKSKKKVVISSDMYLDKDTIQKILANNKIKYDKLYLSSDIMKTKSKGSMFKYIIDDNKVEPQNIIHIGDNRKSDYIMPKLNGIKSILIKKEKTKKYNNIIVDYSINCADNDLCEKDSDYFYDFGYKYLGLLMLNFCKYIYSNVNNRDKIIFLAREGQFMKKCYDKMYDNNSSKYMFVSRKSVSGALLHHFNDIDDMIVAQSLSPSETIETFLKRWDIINNNTIELLKQNNIDIKKNLFDKNEIEKLKKILEELKIKSNARLKNIVFNKYLEQFDIDNTSSFVDIGWSGTMHDLIQYQLNTKNVSINSFYLGVRKKKKNGYKHGFVFNGEEDDIEVLSRSMTGFLEILFSANHGTTTGYKEEKQRIIEILAENDISKFELMQIQKIQNGCLDYISKYKKDSLLMNYEYSNDSYRPLFEFCINPKIEDINRFKKFCVVDEREYNLIGNRYGIKYIFHPKSFVKDYILSCWKNAYLKSIFKIKLPYNQFFKIAYKRR